GARNTNPPGRGRGTSPASPKKERPRGGDPRGRASESCRRQEPNRQERLYREPEGVRKSPPTAGVNTGTHQHCSPCRASSVRPISASTETTSACDLSPCSAHAACVGNATTGSGARPPARAARAASAATGGAARPPTAPLPRPPPASTHPTTLIPPEPPRPPAAVSTARVPATPGCIPPPMTDTDWRSEIEAVLLTQAGRM